MSKRSVRLRQQVIQGKERGLIGLCFISRAVGNGYVMPLGLRSGLAQRNKLKLHMQQKIKHDACIVFPGSLLCWGMHCLLGLSVLVDMFLAAAFQWAGRIRALGVRPLL